MPGQESLFQRFFSRREVVKGLAAATLAAGVAGCSSPGSSSTVTPTPTHTTHLRPGSVVYTYYPTSPMFALAWSPDDQYFVTSIALGNVIAGGTSGVQITQA